MIKKYFYVTYSSDDKIINVYNNIGEVIINLYKIEKSHPLYRNKYLQMHRSISRNKKWIVLWWKSLISNFTKLKKIIKLNQLRKIYKNSN